ncbi:MAG: CHASE2 domain-containing protein [Kovacikia sp.]
MIKGSFRRIKVIPELVVIVTVIAARLVSGLQFLEWATLDTFLRLRPAEPMDDRVVIVGIRESDIQQAGTYPIPDQAIAALIRQVEAYHPTVIGLDLFRDLPVPPGHPDLVKEFRTTPNLIGIDKTLPDRSGMSVKPPPGYPA